MEADDLPSIDPNIDYTKILPIHQKRTIAFINHFIMNTVSFLNHFAQSCESRLMDFEYKLQKVEASLLILESQLASISDLNDISDTAVESKNDPAEASHGNDPVEDSSIVSTEVEGASEKNEATEDQGDSVVTSSEGPRAAEDPRFAKFFKMVQFGVPPTAVKLKMKSEGIDPSILDNPNQVVPGSTEVDIESESNTTDSD